MMSVEDAIIELRDAVQQSLSIDLSNNGVIRYDSQNIGIHVQNGDFGANHGNKGNNDRNVGDGNNDGNFGGNCIVQNNNDRANETNNATNSNDGNLESSQSTQLSSLSGSLPAAPAHSGNEGVGNGRVITSRRRLFSDWKDGAGPGDGDRNNCGVGSRRSSLEIVVEIASHVERAVSNYERALVEASFENVPSLANAPRGQGGRQNDNVDGDVVDLLVAVMTAVPHSLFRAHSHSNPQQMHPHIMSGFQAMERICFSAASIASNILVSYFCKSNCLMEPPENQVHSPYHHEMQYQRKNLLVLDNHNAYDLLEELISICENGENDPSDVCGFGWHLVCPIIKVLNAFSEYRHKGLHRDEMNRIGETGGMDDPKSQLFSDFSAKETLRLTQLLMKSFMSENFATAFPDVSNDVHGHDLMEEMSSEVGLFVGSLSEQFANKAAFETDHNSPIGGESEPQLGLFDTWANSTDEHMVHRLNETDAQEFFHLINQYHIGSVQSASELIESCGHIIDSFVSNNEPNEQDIKGTAGANGANGASGTDESNVEDVLNAVQETIRYVAMAGTVTEVIDKLGFHHEDDMKSTLFSLIISYAKFIASYFHDALLALQEYYAGYDIEGLSVMADGLLLQLCQTSTGVEFLKHEDVPTEEQTEVLAIALLRAVHSQCSSESLNFLLEIVVGHVQNAKLRALSSQDPSPKRQRFDNRRHFSNKFGSFRSGYRSPLHSPRGSSDETRDDMIDILLACMALVQPNPDEDINDISDSHYIQLSLVASSLMTNDKSEEGVEACEENILDCLNPWHTLNVKSLKNLSLDVEKDFVARCDDAVVPVSSYALVAPSFHDTSSCDIEF